METEPGRLVLSDLESLAVVDAAGAGVGELIDVLASLTPDPPPVTGFIVGTDDEQLRATWDQVAEIDVDGERLLLNAPAAELAPASLSGDEIELVESVLDNQVLDVERRKFIRVQDVVLEVADGILVVAGVDASSGAVMRRMGLGFLSRRLRERPGDFVPWDDVNLISVRLSRANFIEAFTEIAELHPADLADVIGQVGPRERAAVLAALNAPLAADTLEEMDPELATAALVEMPRRRATALIRHIEPDEAADMLADLPDDVAEEILSRLPPERSLALRGLASHPEHSAGALMTTDVVGLSGTLTAGAALDRIRASRPTDTALAAIFVVDDERRLLGALSLAELVLAAPDRALSELMDDDCPRVDVDTDEDEVGRTMTKYDLLALPVTDDEGRLLGIVTLDDALDAIVPEDWKSRLPRLFR
ncbi:MAG TPA: CBS domain-containing protein [Thermoleophilia bacterium]|nr:CBS domain-containing protein [Thermoleophilia bacterium]